ncbi:Unknown protein [Striga hermonthica]|uniref:Reverse transcriptase zinc-binding domain-containing protein n=1 Tax=Striga hermonthica TaxID=68872 RepID=A0A9N7N484_STRHE|nr:Unknown protein [Striga hermonthica]
MVDKICCWCGDEEENLEHLMFTCARARRVWKLAGLSWDCLQDTQTSFSDWWTCLSSLKPSAINKARVSLSTYLLWWLWKTRNTCLFQNSRISELQLVEAAKLEWQEYDELKFGRSLFRKVQIGPGKITTSVEAQGVGDLLADSSASSPQAESWIMHGTAFVNSALVASWEHSRGVFSKHSVDDALFQLRNWLDQGCKQGWQKVILKVSDKKFLKLLLDCDLGFVESAVLLEDICSLRLLFSDFVLVDCS